LDDVAVCVTVVVYRSDVRWLSISLNLPLVLYGCDTLSLIRKHFSTCLRVKVHEPISLVVKICLPLGLRVRLRPSLDPRVRL
jgi:hypothetical protein